MATVEVSSIEQAAEDAIRSASGNWDQAGRLLREKLDKSPALQEALLDRSLRRELREAARRLGLGTVSCPSCGEEIPLDATQCRFCSETLGPASSEPQAPRRPQTGGPIIRHFTLLTGWILIVLIVILIITFAT